MTHLPPVPLNEGSSTDGVQGERFARSAESGHHAPMGWEGAWKAIERTCLVLGAAAGLGTLYFTANPPKTASPAPETLTHAASTVSAPLPWPLFALGALSIVLLATGWAMMLLRRPSNSSKGATASPVSLEAPDITEAKGRLCSFVMNTLSPAIVAMGETFGGASTVILLHNRGNFLAELAAEGVNRYRPSRPSVDVFLDVQNVRAKPMVEMERDALKHIYEYRAALSSMHKVLKALRETNVVESRWSTDSFQKHYPAWLILHKTLVRDINRIAADTHLPRIGAAMSVPLDSDPSDLEDYPLIFRVDHSAS